MSSNLIDTLELGYQTGGGVIPLPKWAKFFVDLGFALGRRAPSEGGRIVVGLALPTRAYAATLMGLGIICARASTETQIRDATEYFSFLRQQPIGTAVRFFREGRVFKGELDRNAVTNGQQQIKVKYRANGKLTCWRHFDISDCSAIEICPDKPDLAHRQKGHAVVQHPFFLEALVGKKAAESFYFTSRLECLFIGSVGKIGEELSDLLAVRSVGQSWIPGILQDVVRARRLFPGGQAFRSTIQAAVSRTSPLSALPEIPPFVVFDSAGGYVKWHDEARESVHVVVLDRSDRLFDDAATTLTTRFYRRAGDVTDLHLSNCPAAIEPIVFLEKA